MVQSSDKTFIYFVSQKTNADDVVQFYFTQHPVHDTACPVRAL